MSYVVIKDFKDLQDNDHIYRANDPFPREGVAVSKERIQELSSEDNKRKEVLIEAVEGQKLDELSVEQLQKVTNDDIKARLDELEIEYKSNDNKDTLIERLRGKEGDQ